MSDRHLEVVPDEPSGNRINIHAVCPEHGHPALNPTAVIQRDEFQREALCICAYGHAWIERWNHVNPESEAS